MENSWKKIHTVTVEWEPKAIPPCSSGEIDLYSGLVRTLGRIYDLLWDIVLDGEQPTRLTCVLQNNPMCYFTVNDQVKSNEKY